MVEQAFIAKVQQKDKLEETNSDGNVSYTIETYVDRFTKVPQVYAYGIVLRTEKSYASGYFLFDPNTLI